MGTSKFGWPRPARIEEFNRLVNQARISPEMQRFEFQGRLQTFPVLTISIDLPKYRLANGRTCSQQDEFLAKNSEFRRDLFSGDAEMLDAQMEQHKLLLDVADESGLREKFLDTAQRQVEPLVLDEDGFVVNGNRRLCTWRSLLEADAEKYGHFRNIAVIVLPHCDPRDIDRLEAQLQVEKEVKANYTWDALANMMKRHQERNGLSNSDLAELYKMKDSEVVQLMDMLAYADEYLVSRNKSNLWSQVASAEYAFETLVKSRPRVDGIGKQELLKQAAFTLIDEPDEAGGRLYSSIKDIASYINVVRDRLQDVFQVEVAQTDNGIDDLFGAAPVANAAAAAHISAVDVALAAHIQKPENAQSAREAIVDAIESQRQLKKDAQTANFLLKKCAKAQAELMDAVQAGLTFDAVTQGVELQIQQIEGLLDRIKQFLNEQHA
jgi:hypothetical protein